MKFILLNIINIYSLIQSLWSFWIRLKLTMIRLYSTHRKNCQQISLVWGWCVKPGFLYCLIGISYYLHYCNYNPSFVLMPRLTSENFRPKPSLKFKIGILDTHLSSFRTWAARRIELKILLVIPEIRDLSWGSSQAYLLREPDCLS